MKNKVGKETNSKNYNCNRDVKLVRNLMDIRIKKLSKEVREAKRLVRLEMNKLVKKSNKKKVDKINKERDETRNEVIKVEREILNIKFKFLKNEYGNCCEKHKHSESIAKQAKEAHGKTQRLEQLLSWIHEDPIGSNY